MKTVLYIAQSEDGYIATDDGGVRWLEKFSDGSVDYGFHAFMDTIDTTIMGENTYKQILTFGSWPYKGKSGVIFTDDEIDPSLPSTVVAANGSPQQVVDRLGTEHAETKKNLWLVGGAQLIDSFLEDGLVDEMIIFTMPVSLGSGIPLFLKEGRLHAFTETASKEYDNGSSEKRYQLTAKK